MKYRTAVQGELPLIAKTCSSYVLPAAAPVEVATEYVVLPTVRSTAFTLAKMEISPVQFFARGRDSTETPVSDEERFVPLASDSGTRNFTPAIGLPLNCSYAYVSLSV